MPQFAHLPLLLNPDRSKLSKRQGDVATEDYRDKGYLPEALVNFVALLGWNPGDERELFTLEELTKEFSLDRVGKSGAIFNIEKLNWMNAEHLRKKSAAEILPLLRQALAKSEFAGQEFPDEYLVGIIAAMRERVSFVRDFVEKCPYFFQPPSAYDPEVVKKRWKKETSAYLRALVEEFSKLSTPAQADYEAALHRVAEALKIKNSELIHPLRLAVSGMGAGPGVYDILALLGKEESIRRITKALETLHTP
jgi:glutamyl-tRNA synthetase